MAQVPLPVPTVWQPLDVRLRRRLPGPGVVSAMTTWGQIEAVIDEHGGTCSRRYGGRREYRVPSPTGGTFLVEVDLRPRWCSLTIDRWRTTHRDETLARPWLEANVWPVVTRASEVRRRSWGTLPAGGPTISTATPIARGDLVDVLAAWVAAELTWG